LRFLDQYEQLWIDRANQIALSCNADEEKGDR